MDIKKLNCQLKRILNEDYDEEDFGEFVTSSNFLIIKQNKETNDYIEIGETVDGTFKVYSETFGLFEEEYDTIDLAFSGYKNYIKNLGYKIVNNYEGQPIEYHWIERDSGEHMYDTVEVKHLKNGRYKWCSAHTNMFKSDKTFTTFEGAVDDYEQSVQSYDNYILKG